MSKKLLFSFFLFFFAAIQLKAQTNLNFSSNDSGAWSDGIAQDGDGGSINIPNFDLQFYPTNSSFNPLGGFCSIEWGTDMDLFGSGNPTWNAITPNVNYTGNNNGIQAFVIKSTDPTKKFSLNSISMFEWGGQNVTYIFFTYRGGNYVGNIYVTMNSANGPITLNQAGALTPNVFNNIDEIRILPQGNNRIFPSFNNISVTPSSSNNANLSNLSINAGTLNPTFNSNTTSYSVSLANATTSIAVTPIKADANATITVNGASVTSGSSSNNINLNVGANVIYTTVTAQDGTTKTYTLTATRAASANADLSGLSLSSGTLSPIFNTSNTSYTVSLANATSFIAVTPTKADANATIKVNGTTVTSGFASNNINLNVGQNTITTLVTAQDGTTTKTYTITATRSKADQTITFPAIANKLTTDADFEPLATATSGLALSYNTDNSSVATVYQDATDGNKWKIKIQGAGNCTITANQAGDNNYNPASASRSFTVTAVLPVSLTNYTIKKQNNGEVLINWITASEQNNEKFIISRSSDGILFKIIANISAASNGQQINSYHFSDLFPENGSNYYKLTQQDKDGKYIDLGIRSIDNQLDEASNVKIYPNPTTDFVTISFTPGIFTKMSLFNLEGKLILKQEIYKGSNSIECKTNGLAQGTYVIKMTGLGGSSAYRIIKN
jgi:hypothetical protein